MFTMSVGVFTNLDVDEINLRQGHNIRNYSLVQESITKNT